MRVLALCVVATGVFAFGQHGAGRLGGGHPNIVASRPSSNGSGFGNVVFPGGAPGHPVIIPPGNITNTSFGGALGATVRGVPPGGGGGRRNGGRGVIVPYPVLVSPYGYGYGGYYGDPNGGYGYGPPQQQEPYYPQQQAPPVVIINQNFKPETASPVVREYPDLPPAAASQEPTLKVFENRNRQIEDDKPTIFLIALKEGNVMPALAFWVEGDTMHYITRESSHNTISLDRVDREFSARLNKERGLEFRLP